MKNISEYTYYTPEEIELHKFYYKGDGLYKLIERTGKSVESYPGKFSNVYKFVIFNVETGNFTSQEIVLNPSYECFRNVERTDMENIIKYKQKVLDNLITVFKECKF